MIHCVKVLKASGYPIPPHLLLRWARRNDWPEAYAVALRDFALGTLAGVHYPAGPANFSMSTVEDWKHEVASEPDAYDSGDLSREDQGFPLVRIADLDELELPNSPT